MSKFVTGNLFLAMSILLTSISQVMLKAMMSELDENGGFTAKMRQLFEASRFWRAALIATMIVGAFLCWVTCLSKLDLSYAYPLACGSAMLIAFLSVMFLGETVTWRVWIGTFLIMLGTVFLAPTK